MSEIRTVLKCKHWGLPMTPGMERSKNGGKFVGPTCAKQKNGESVSLETRKKTPIKLQQNNKNKISL